jgi:diguanylate cyclase (GGDEF)-like protein
MGPAPAPDEEARLLALQRLHVLDSRPEERFDRITRLAGRALDMPIAAISFVDRTRIWFKSLRGMSVDEVPRDGTFWDLALVGAGPLVVEDAAADPRFDALPMVAGPPYLRCYASQPLFAADGQRLGDLCVGDIRPRRLDSGQLEILRDLARIVEDELEIGVLTEVRSALASDLDTARRQIHLDSLTGTLSRAGILELLQRESARARRSKSQIGVAMVDLDHFKEVNDCYGHLVGDGVLRAAAQRMEEAVRPYDAVGRYGGEEFLIVLTERDPARVAAIAERVREHLARRPVVVDGRAIAISASVGVACGDALGGETALDDLLRRADEALYRAKRGGRNQVVVAG